MIKNRIMVLLALFSLAFFAACNKSEENGTAQLKVMLTDGPADYDEVWVDVQSIEIHSEAEGWVTYDLLHPGLYNLLDFSNGLDTLIADLLLPAGNVSQMRLLLGSNNSVVVDGVSYDLTTPSAQQSGLKFNIHQNLAPNGSYSIWIDFDAGRSVVQTGSGSYILKPVIRAYTEETNGRIRGTVEPVMSHTVVYAVQGMDSATAIPDDLGFFMMSGLPEGSYTLFFDGDESSGFSDVVVEDVNITFGMTTDIGTVVIPNL